MKKIEHSPNLKVHFQRKITENLIEKVADKVYTNKRITPQDIPSLNSPFSIDCLGLNGNLVGAKSIFFGSSAQTIQPEVNTFLNVVYHLQVRLNKEPSKHFYLIADEPNDVSSKQHKYWERLHKDQLIQLKNSDHLLMWLML